MHILYDEHGNPVPHGSALSHEHEHSHDGAAHSHAHTHEHGHEHEHSHDHEHTHCHHEHECSEKDCGSCQSHGASEQDQMTAVLDYMLKHNQHHAAELDAIAGKLRSQGKEAAAEQLVKAVGEFEKGNMYLGLALSLVKES